MVDTGETVRRLAERICCVMEPGGEGDWMAYRDAAEAVLDEFEQVGWWVEDKHRHSTPQPHGIVCGEFRFTEEEDGCPLSGSPVYRMSPSFDEGAVQAPNDFVCNRIGPGHQFGSVYCTACVPSRKSVDET